MSKEKITYYAIVGDGRTADSPLGIVRRRESPEFGISDESLHRDLTWHRTGAIAEWKHGDLMDDLEEVSEEKANEIIEGLRAEFG